MKLSLIKKQSSQITKKGKIFEEPKDKKPIGDSIKILITGGHLTPAISVIDELNKQGYNNLIWVGHKHSQVMDKNESVEFKYVTSKGIKFITLRAGKLFRVWGLDTLIPGIKSLLYIPIGFLQAMLILIKYRPKLVISFGGYLALPIVFFAFIFRIKRVTHEQTIVSGLSNRLIGKFANLVFISWKPSKRFFNPKKTILTGNPVRKAIFEIKGTNFNIENDLPTIYITGGNQGSNIINSALIPLLPGLLHEFNIVHQTGNSSITQDFDKCKLIKSKLEENLSRRYTVKDYVGENEIGYMLNKADLVIGRSGANTCTEILALQKYAVLIPIPNTSKNEQLLNAKALEELGLARVLEQKDLQPESLNKAIYEVLRYKAMGLNINGKNILTTVGKIKEIYKPDAASIIVNESLKLIS